VRPLSHSHVGRSGLGVVKCGVSFPVQDSLYFCLVPSIEVARLGIVECRVILPVHRILWLTPSSNLSLVEVYKPGEAGLGLKCEVSSAETLHLWLTLQLSVRLVQVYKPGEAGF
jgi:hypothetical protein